MSTTTIYRQIDAAVDYKAITADTTLTASDSGKIISLDAVGEAITLPAPAAGLNFEFECNTTTATSDWVITATGAIIYGSAQVAGAVVAASAETTITLVVAKFLPGDWIRLRSDGTKWYVEGSVVTAAGCTFA
jgi:hypothetical protein